MFSLFKKKTNGVEIPEWASFFEGTEYSLFIKEVENYFMAINIPFKIENGMVILEENDVFDIGNMGLLNVAQVCKQEDPKQYKAIIADHFDTIIRIKQFNKDFEAISHNFDEVKKYIGVRLYENGYVAHLGKEHTVGKDFAGDIYAMVVFDLPESISNVKLDQMKAWNKSADELFELGIENIRSNYEFAVTKESMGEHDLWFVHGEHFFTPNIVFELEERKELVGTYGSLVGLPHRHAALIYPIEGMEVVSAVNALIPVIYGMNDEGPGSLSDNVFWYKDGTFTQLPYQVEDGKLQFFPPDNFVDFLNQLS